MQIPLLDDSFVAPLTLPSGAEQKEFIQWVMRNLWVEETLLQQDARSRILEILATTINSEQAVLNIGQVYQWARTFLNCFVHKKLRKQYWVAIKKLADALELRYSYQDSWVQQAAIFDNSILAKEQIYKIINRFRIDIRTAIKGTLDLEVKEWKNELNVDHWLPELHFLRTIHKVHQDRYMSFARENYQSIIHQLITVAENPVGQRQDPFNPLWKNGAKTPEQQSFLAETFCIEICTPEEYAACIPQDYIEDLVDKLLAKYDLLGRYVCRETLTIAVRSQVEELYFRYTKEYLLSVIQNWNLKLD